MSGILAGLISAALYRPAGGAPTLSSATINTAGTQLTLTFTASVSIGAGGNGGVTLSLSGGAVTATYASGSGSNTLVYNLSRTVNSGETGTVSYTQPGNGIEATTGGADVATFSGSSVTNSSTQGAGPTRTQVATDDFNRTAGALTTNWTQMNAVNAGNVQIATGNIQIAGAVYGGDASARWSGDGNFTADQYSSMQVSGSSGTANYGIGVMVRGSGADETCTYYGVVLADQLYLDRVVNGVSTTLASGNPTSWADSDRLEIEAQGTTIRVLKNGTALGGAWTVTDANISTGAPGVIGRGDPGVSWGDNWIGGNLS